MMQRSSDRRWLSLRVTAVVLAGVAMAPVAAAQTAPWLMLTGPNPGYVEVPHDPALNPTDALTIELWAHLVSHESWTGGGCVSLVGKAYTEAYWLGDCSGRLRLYTHGSGSARDSSGTFPLGEWVHLAVVFDGTDTHYYFNGVLDSTRDAIDGPMPANTAALRIGSSTDYNIVPVGALDEVRIWNVARTQGEIAAAMHTTIDTATPGLVASWSFASDASDPVGGHDGTLVGDALLGGEIPAANPCVREYFVAAGAHAAGVGTSQWRTDMTFFNRSGDPASVEVFLLRRDSDNSAPQSITFGLPAAATQTYSDVVLSEFGQGSLAAAFRVCSDQILQVESRTFNQSGSGTFGQGIPGVLATLGAASGSTQYLIAVSENAAFRTNVGFVNATAAVVTVELELFDGDGASLGLLEYRLQPFGHRQISRIFTELTGSEVTNGRIRVRPNGGRVITYASVIDALTDDGTFMLAR